MNEIKGNITVLNDIDFETIKKDIMEYAENIRKITMVNQNNEKIQIEREKYEIAVVLFVISCVLLFIPDKLVQGAGIVLVIGSLYFILDYHWKKKKWNTKQKETLLNRIKKMDTPEQYLEMIKTLSNKTDKCNLKYEVAFNHNITRYENILTSYVEWIDKIHLSSVCQQTETLKGCSLFSILEDKETGNINEVYSSVDVKYNEKQKEPAIIFHTENIELKLRCKNK